MNKKLSIGIDPYINSLCLKNVGINPLINIFESRDQSLDPNLWPDGLVQNPSDQSYVIFDNLESKFHVPMESQSESYVTNIQIQI